MRDWLRSFSLCRRIIIWSRIGGMLVIKKMEIIIMMSSISIMMSINMVDRYIRRCRRRLWTGLNLLCHCHRMYSTNTSKSIHKTNWDKPTNNQRDPSLHDHQQTTCNNCHNHLVHENHQNPSITYPNNSFPSNNKTPSYTTRYQLSSNSYNSSTWQ